MVQKIVGSRIGRRAVIAHLKDEKSTVSVQDVRMGVTLGEEPVMSTCHSPPCRAMARKCQVCVEQ